MTLRLGFHYHIPMARGADGRLRTPGYQGRFLDSLALAAARISMKRIDGKVEG